MAKPPPPAQPQQAIDWFKARVPFTVDEGMELEERAAKRGFYVSGVTQLRLVGEVHQAVTDALEKGTTLADFKRDVGAKLTAEWGGPRPAQLETVFRNGVQSAYNAGRLEQFDEPMMKRLRPYRAWSVILDARTTEAICRPLAGVVVPADSAFARSRVPPLHHRAMTSDTMVTTKTGPVMAGNVRAGMEVLTHRRRWRRVTAVLHTLVKGDAVLRLELATGRVLRVTKEHPVLRCSPTGPEWVPAGDIQPGDKLFEHGHEFLRPIHVQVADADNAPPLGDEPSVPESIGGHARAVGVTLAIEFQGHALGDEGEVDDVAANGVLRDGSTVEERKEVRLRWGEFLTVRGSDGARAFLSDTGHGAGVVSPHPLSHLGAPHPEGPVVLAAALGDRRGVLRADGSLGDARPHRDAVLPAQKREPGFAHSHVALECADALLSLPVLALNQLFKGGPVAGVEWHASAVASIVGEAFTGELCDISVDEDASYVACGVVVHNCRTGLMSLSAAQAGEEGITKNPPHAPPAKGFGGDPTREAPKPIDVSAEPEKLREMFDHKQKGHEVAPSVAESKSPSHAQDLAKLSESMKAARESAKAAVKALRSVPGGDLGARVAKEHPLLSEIFGARLTVDGKEAAQTDQALGELRVAEKIPEAVLRVIAAQHRIHVGPKKVNNLGSEAWQEAARSQRVGASLGTYYAPTGDVCVNTAKSWVNENGAATLAHELGHAFDVNRRLLDLSGGPTPSDPPSSLTPEFTAAWREFKRGAFAMSKVPYFTNAHAGRLETYAEAFSILAAKGRDEAVRYFSEPVVDLIQRDIDKAVANAARKTEKR